MRHAAFPLMLITHLITVSIPTAEAQQEFSIYCSSNMDGTGKCRKAGSDEVINCLIIPGGVVACKGTDKKKYECVQYGAIAANQTQFACVDDTDNSVNDQLFETDEFKSSPDSTSTPSIQSDATQQQTQQSQDKPTSSEPPPQPMIQNPFQASPNPEITGNEFQSVF